MSGEDEDVVGGPLVQLAIYEPDASPSALLGAIAEVLRARGATTRPSRWGGADLEVLNGTGALPAGVSERLEPVTRDEEGTGARTGAIVELLTGGEWFDPDLGISPELGRQFGTKVRDCLFDLVIALRPLYAAVLFEYPSDALARVDTAVDGVPFGAAAWVNLQRVDVGVDALLRRAVHGAATAEVGGGLYFTSWSEFAPDGAVAERASIPAHLGLRVLEALTGRTITAPVSPTPEEIDAMWWLKPPVDRPTVWVWDAALDETQLLTGVAACSEGRDVELGVGRAGWRCASIDLVGAEDDEAMDILRSLAERMGPSWISLSGALDIEVPGADDDQLEGFAMSHVWLNRRWLGEGPLARIDEHLAGAYRAEHAGGVYFSTGERFNPSGRAPGWSNDDAFDRETAAAAVVAEVARRDRGLGAPAPPR